ncbi:hypothetical protein PVAND_012748 [Polypedilum vanderplanki]|uniref:Uncharacterized protein n=1 Tax=Polypedilum vanderplanki TaxID=319348 RepID=A0A9J6CPE3_POLVA|nr:hypothetical protein PVAND_012748 [Polypedilum vanderplanki]
MDTKKKIRKHIPSSSSSSSSDDDDSSSSSSSSSETHRKPKHRGSGRKHDSSSSSEEEVVRKSHKHQHKKPSVRKHSHSAKMKAKMLQANAKKPLKSMSPSTSSRHKHHSKTKLVKKAKLEEHERHLRRSRTPTRRDVKKDRTPEHRIASPNTRIRVSVTNNRAIQERSRLMKDSPSSRRHVRETIDDRSIIRDKEREKMRRIQEEEQQHYKYLSKSGERSSRVMQSSRITPEKHHHERSRSHSHGRIPIRERLDKEYDYRRSISREQEEYSMMRGGESHDRSYDYRQDDRRIPKHEYGPSSSSSSRIYEDRPHKISNWESNRMEQEPRSNQRLYEGSSSGNLNRSWDQQIHERKRIPEDVLPYKERQWSDSHDKWNKEKEPQDWKRGPSWKDQQLPPQVAPTIPYARRFPGPAQMQEKWTPRGMAPHKIEPHSSSSAPFKPRGSPYFGFKQRFPYKRFPNQYSKINFPSKHVIPSTQTTATATANNNPEAAQVKTEEENNENASKVAAANDQTQQQQQQLENLANESGELMTETEEEKIIQPDTTFSGNTDANYQEECEGNLSEFSDVDDDILNREEARANAEQNQQPQMGSEQNEVQIEEQKTQDPSEQKMISKIHANKELKKEMDLDFEEISDGELEQESAIKGLGDALGVDWTSLANLQRPINRSAEEFYNATKSRWSAHRILWDIGISAKFAGEDFARKTLTEARNELRREKQEWRLKRKEQIKIENKVASLNGDIKKEEVVLNDVDIKQEPIDSECENDQKHTEINNTDEIIDDQEDFELDTDVLTHPIAQVQVLMRKLAIQRKNLILNSTGKYGRALSARKDLKLRRQLCNLPTKDLNIDRNCTVNPEINKRMDEIFRQLVDGVN